MELLEELRQATYGWKLAVENHPKIIQVVPVISRNVMRYKNSSSTSRIVCWTTPWTSGNTAMGAPCLKLSSSGQYYDTPRNTPTFRDQIRNYLRYEFEVVTGGLCVNKARLISIAEIYECPNKLTWIARDTNSEQKTTTVEHLSCLLAIPCKILSS